MFADICLLVGQVVIFQWDGTEHNVERVDSQAYQSCEGIQKTEGERGPYLFNATEEGDFYFVCGVGNHIFFLLFYNMHGLRSLDIVKVTRKLWSALRVTVLNKQPLALVSTYQLVTLKGE